MTIRARSIWPACVEGTHGVCRGRSTTAECICWHHVEAERRARRLVALVDDVMLEAERVEWLLEERAGG